MATTLAVFCVLVILTSLYGIARPRRLVAFAKRRRLKSKGISTPIRAKRE